jgi:hypothetical protein
MAKKKSMWILFGIIVLSAWVLGSAIQAGAETMNYKFYTWLVKEEAIPVDDVEGHIVMLAERKSFYVFENGEVATGNFVVTGDFVKKAGPWMQYGTLKFQDGSTIIYKSQGVFGGGAASMKSEILKGTGRFEGIKGTQSGKAKYLPPEKGEPGGEPGMNINKGYGEGSFTYTLPTK